MTKSMPISARIYSVMCALVPMASMVGCADLQVPEEAAGQDLERIRRGGVYSQYELYVEPDTNASRQADEWRSTDPDGAAIMDELASAPLGIWLGDWLDDVEGFVDDAVTRAGDDLQTFVVYNIPNRDCGSYSAGGVDDAQDYADFVEEIAEGLDGRLALVVLEPDGLALVRCLDDDAEAEREQMMSDAVDTLTAAGAKVYLDAGDSNWIPADEMAQQLLDAGVERAAGFALNVSHTEFTRDEIAYAEEIRAIVGENAHYVIDTSRNGLGPAEDNEWCNPAGRANGRRPTLQVGNTALDALLWIKPPGESDGTCNGGPEAGHWWPEYALELAVLADEVFAE
jgi:endoglucanase